MLKVTANEILGGNTMRIVLEEGTKTASFNLSGYTYNQIALRLIKVANIETATNLILDNGGERHREPNMSLFVI